MFKPYGKLTDWDKLGAVGIYSRRDDDDFDLVATAEVAFWDTVLAADLPSPGIMYLTDDCDDESNCDPVFPDVYCPHYAEGIDCPND